MTRAAQLAGAVLCAALSAVAVTLPAAVDLGGEPGATAVTAAPVRAGTSARPPELGVQFHGLWTGVTARERRVTLDRIAGAGADWVRLDISWAMVEPQRGQKDHQWGVPLIDRTIAAAHRRGLRVLGTFWLTPGWANHGAGERAAPEDPQDYARALAWMARRYEGQVQAWEVWNEPNSEDFLVDADPVAYTRLLCAAHDAVDRSGADAEVVFGGLMYNDSDFLRSAYRAGAVGCFDVLGLHPYPAPSDAPPGLADDGSVWRLRHLDTIRELRSEHGDDKPVWATEFGWSAHANAPGLPPWERGVSERVQARYAVRALRILGRDYPWVERAFWYNDVMKDTGDAHQDGFGMLRKDLSPRPVWRALRRLYR